MWLLLRKLVKTLTDTEYDNVIAVLSSYPHLEVAVETRGIKGGDNDVIWLIELSVLDDEEQSKITAGSVVTVVVKITRISLMVGNYCLTV